MRCEATFGAGSWAGEQLIFRASLPAPTASRRQGGRGRAAVLTPSASATVVESGGDDTAAPAHGLPSGCMGKAPVQSMPVAIVGRSGHRRPTAVMVNVTTLGTATSTASTSARPATLRNADKVSAAAAPVADAARRAPLHCPRPPDQVTGGDATACQGAPP